MWQRKCEDALFSLLVLGARRPVRHLASTAMGKIIYKGDTISIYSRVSSLQGFISDGKKSEPLRLAGLFIYFKFEFTYMSTFDTNFIYFIMVMYLYDLYSVVLCSYKTTAAYKRSYNQYLSLYCQVELFNVFAVVPL